MTAILEASPVSEVLGSITPRIWTKPLVTGPPGPCGCGCALTRETTMGFEVDDFARDELRHPLDPWERWLVIHGMELLPNGWPRFRQLVVLVARQNGKTELLVILSIYWMWVARVAMVLGTSTKLDYSRESWLKVVKLIQRTPEFAPEIAPRGRIRSVNGEQEVSTSWDSRYKIAAANEEGGRSLTVNRLVEDEIRQHHDYSAHAAAENTMNAVDDAQAWAISNEGDDRSVVLHDLYDAAIEFIESGEGDERLGLFAWSAPDGCDLEDVQAAAQANPNLGRRIRWANLVGKARRAKLAGGEIEAKYRTEVLCQRVASLVPKPIGLEAWNELVSDQVPSGTPNFFVDCSPDLGSSSIAGAVSVNGVPHVSLAACGPGTDWLVFRAAELKRQYPLAKWQWEANGPASAFEEAFRKVGIINDKPAPSIEMARGCSHMQKLVKNHAMTHSGDEAVEAALGDAVKRETGDPGLWVWGRRKSSGDISPLVACTGALWLLETTRLSMPQIF